jgi:hypothetical protein
MAARQWQWRVTKTPLSVASFIFFTFQLKKTERRQWEWRFFIGALSHENPKNG